MRKITKRTIAVTAGLAIAVGGSGIAFAYWSAGGSGTGEAAAGTTVGISAVQTTTVTEMQPGDTAQALSGNFTNTNDSPVYVSTVTASITSVTKAAGAPAGTCDASDYTVATPVATVNAQVPNGVAQGAWAGATIQFNNKPAANQDGCKGATVALGYAIA